MYSYNCSWLPCINAFNHRNRFTIQITVPHSFIALCTGELVLRSKLKNRSLFKYDIPYGIRANDLSIVVGPFQQITISDIYLNYKQNETDFQENEKLEKNEKSTKSVSPTTKKSDTHKNKNSIESDDDTLNDMVGIELTDVLSDESTDGEANDVIVHAYYLPGQVSFS